MSQTKRFNLIHYESKGFKKLHLFANEKITPELAKDLLTLNTENRPLKNGLVNKYTQDMKTGDWTFTGDVIRISSEGKLLDSQHRLWAIINTGNTQVFHIQTGLAPEAFNKIDINKVRTHGDTLAMQGYNNYSIVATVVRYVSMYKAKMLADYLQSSNKMKFSNQEISEMAKKLDTELLQTSATIANRLYHRNKFMDTTTVSSLYYIFSEINRNQAMNFFDMLSTGDGLGTDNHPSIYLLRNRLITTLSSGNKVTLKHKWALVIRAWNFYRMGKGIKVLTYNDQDEFPKPI